MMLKGALDRDTETFLTDQLHELSEQEGVKKREITTEESEQKRWTALYSELNDLHTYCQSVVVKIDDPSYELSYDEKRKSLEKLGISVQIYKKGNEHRVKMECKPPFIVSILS